MYKKHTKYTRTFINLIMLSKNSNMGTALRESGIFSWQTPPDDDDERRGVIIIIINTLMFGQDRQKKVFEERLPPGGRSVGV